MIEEQSSKRERQKARREARLAAERAAQARARRNRMLAFAGVAVLVLAGIGLAVQRQRTATAADRAAQAAVAGRLDQLGCTKDGAMPDRGGGHLNAAAEIAANPPDKLYPDRPASSGMHTPYWVVSGVYDTLIDERPLVHSLEHGWINVYYLRTAPADQVEQLKAWAKAQIDGSFPKMIVAPWIGGDLPGGANFAYVAWDFRQLCGRFDPQVAGLFAKAHSRSNSKAPEEADIAATAKADPSRGMFAPSNANLLFPPLEQQLGQGQPNLAPKEASPG
ncbi:MAG: DUF3105 domain-containing protein [Egibacteraceae bacterium]